MKTIEGLRFTRKTYEATRFVCYVSGSGGNRDYLFFQNIRQIVFSDAQVILHLKVQPEVGRRTDGTR